MLCKKIDSLCLDVSYHRLLETYHYIINVVADDAFCLGTKARVIFQIYSIFC